MRHVHRHANATRAGMTFIEVVAAMALIGVIASMIAGTIAFSRNASNIMHRRAEAAEAAHRIIIQHLEDPALLRTGPKRVDLNGTLYGYELEEYTLLGEEDEEAGTTIRTKINAAEASLDERLSAKIHMLTVHVFLDDPDLPSTGETLATISRVYNPLNTDDPEILLRFINEVMEAEIGRLKDEAEAKQNNSSQSGGGTGAGGGGGR